MYNPIILGAAFAFGALIGSFLNVCVYRIPREISISNPARSFCPNCREKIRWFENVPILGWIFLRGRCAHCHAPIRPLYVLIETLTGALFVLAVWRFPFPQAIAIWIFISLLVVATFVDIDFFIIPNSISKGGIVAGLVLSFLMPLLHETSARFVALGLSALGALVGAGILYAVSELGKLLFGRYKVPLENPARFSFEHVPPDEAQIILINQTFRWSEHFYRKSDKITLKAIEVEIDGRAYQNVDLLFFHDRLVVTDQTFPLESIRAVTGSIRAAEFPREAMGFGDVKLMGAIGAFAGWQGAIFTIPAASVIGAIFGLTANLIGKRKWSARIPFGPYLAAGTLLWLFQGPEILGWYWRFLG
jgi:leader peptidase (prepilin peptidase)/N-methyltransferase